MAEGGEPAAEPPDKAENGPLNRRRRLRTRKRIAGLRARTRWKAYQKSRDLLHKRENGA